VYRVMPHVSATIELPFAHGGLQWSARRALAKTLHGQFDRAVVCPNSWKSALIPWWAGIPQRVGYLGEARWGLLTQRLPNPKKNERPPMVAFYAALSGDAALAHDTPVLVPDGVADSAALSALGLERQGYWVMAPGAEYGPAKRWPAEHFAALARAIFQKTDQSVVLLGSSKDSAVCETIRRLANADSPAVCRDLSGKTRLDQAFSVIGHARAMVGNDSGLMHIAAALGVPQVALFGSSSPLHTPPLSDAAQTIWLKNAPHYLPPLDCAPCFARECPLGHTRCLQDITPEMVLERLF
jgi:heptosyltransferase-2